MKMVYDLLLSSKDNLDFCILDSQTESELLNFDAILVVVGTPTIDGKSDLSQIASVGQDDGQADKVLSKVYLNNYATVFTWYY